MTLSLPLWRDRDKSKGAPIYLSKTIGFVSAVMPKEDLGLINFNITTMAVLRKAAINSISLSRPGSGRLCDLRTSHSIKHP